VPGTGCSTGTGWYDFFNIASGTFPTDLPLTQQNGAAITSDINVGNGQALTPTATVTANGVALEACAADDPKCDKSYPAPGKTRGTAISWRQH
jgi:hypothetical protein